MNIKGVIVLSEAKASESPMVKPSRIRNIMMAFGAALMAGVTLAFFSTFLMKPLKASGDQRKNRLACFRGCV